MEAHGKADKLVIFLVLKVMEDLQLLLAPAQLPVYYVVVGVSQIQPIKFSG